MRGNWNPPFTWALNIYIDESSFFGSRRGEVLVSYIIADGDGRGDSREVCFPGYEHATDNELDLMACSLSLKHAPNDMRAGRKIILLTDSVYIHRHLSQGRAILRRPGDKPLTSEERFARSGAPIEDRELWIELFRLAGNAGLWWVTGSRENERKRISRREK